MKHVCTTLSFCALVLGTPVVVQTAPHPSVCSRASQEANAAHNQAFRADLHLRLGTAKFDQVFNLISGKGTARITSIQGESFELEIINTRGDLGFYVKDPQGDGYVDHRWKDFGWDKAEQSDTYKTCRYLEEVAVRLFFEDLRD